MYKQNKYTGSSLKVNKSKEGETMEQKIRRIVNNKEPIKDGAPLIYTERKEGIRASTNIRTDRFMVAVEATDKIQKSYKARREERAKMEEGKGGEPKKGDEGGAQSLQGKGDQTPTK